MSSNLYDPMTDPWGAARRAEEDMNARYRQMLNSLSPRSARVLTDEKAENDRYRNMLAGLGIERVLTDEEAAKIQPQIGRHLPSAAELNDAARKVMEMVAKHVEPPRKKGLPCPPGLANALALHRPVSTDHLEMRDRDARSTTWPR